MATLLLIRHGQASYGQADYDKLSPLGFEQARLVGRLLAEQKIDALFSGPLRRQVETAASIRETAPAIVPATVVPGLAEYPGFDMVRAFLPKLAEADPDLAMGVAKPTALGERGFQTILTRWARDEWRAEGVEHVHAFTARVTSALEAIIRGCASGDRIAVVTSAGPIGVAVGLVFGATPHHMVRTSAVIKNASITELKLRTRQFAWDPERVSLVGFNSIAHLPSGTHTEF
ncbi:histidine phosphatase family protein [soil metagenome]